MIHYYYDTLFYTILHYFTLLYTISHYFTLWYTESTETEHSRFCPSKPPLPLPRAAPTFVGRLIPAWVVSSTTVSRYSTTVGLLRRRRRPRRKTPPLRLTQRCRPWPGKTWTSGADAETTHPLTPMPLTTTTTTTTAATVTTATADTIWRLRLRSRIRIRVPGKATATHTHHHVAIQAIHASSMCIWEQGPVWHV